MQDNIESCYEGKEGYALVDKAQYDKLVTRQKELLEQIAMRDKEIEMLKDSLHDRMRAYSELAERTGNM